MKYFIVPDDSNYSFSVTTERLLFETIKSSNSKLNVRFDKNMPDKMLSSKQNIFKPRLDYSSRIIKNKHHNENSRLELKQKLSDGFENRETDMYGEQNHSVLSDFRPESSEKNCHLPKCERSIQVPEDDDNTIVKRHFLTGSNCTRTTMFYTLMPYYIPYMNYAPCQYQFNAGFATFIQDNLYYDERPRERSTKKTYQYKESYEPKIEWDTTFLEARPDVLVNDIVQDLEFFYPNVVIKKCYCSKSSSSFQHFTFRYIFYILVIILCTK